MAILRGHAIRLTFTDWADHTYVTCSGGFAWPCWGRSSGGRRISSGTGSSARANCISLPNSTAGIIYGVTGVCHQTANRILFPAGTTVSDARGYWASVLLFGHYGTDGLGFIVRTVACSGTSGELPQCPAATGSSRPSGVPDPDMGDGTRHPKSRRTARREATLAKRIQTLYKRQLSVPTARSTLAGDNFRLINSELQVSLRARLPRERGFVPVTSSQIRAMNAIQSELFVRRERSVKRLHSRLISGTEYASEVNRYVSSSLRASARALGKTNFQRFFEIDPGADVIVVDPRIATRAHR